MISFAAERAGGTSFKSSELFEEHARARVRNIQGHNFIGLFLGV